MLTFSCKFLGQKVIRCHIPQAGFMNEIYIQSVFQTWQILTINNFWLPFMASVFSTIDTVPELSVRFIAGLLCTHWLGVHWSRLSYQITDLLSYSLVVTCKLSSN